MRRLLILVLAGALTALIVLPVSPTVNPTIGKTTLRADGSPIPPIPPKPSVGDLWADGSPIPPIPPKPMVVVSVA